MIEMRNIRIVDQSRWLWIGFLAALFLTSLTLSDVCAFQNQGIGSSSKIYPAYEKVRKRILEEAASQEDIKTFRKILQEEREFAIAKQLLQAIAKTSDSNELKQRYKELYKIFITARPNSDVLYSYLQIKLERKVERGDFAEGKLIGPWGWAPLGDAMVLAYRYTHEERFLDLFVRVYDQLLKSRDSELGLVDEVRGRVMKSWSSNILIEHSKGGPKDVKTNKLTIAALMTYPACKFIETVVNDKGLQKKYGAKAVYYLHAVEEAVNEFREEFHLVPGKTNQGYYLMPYEEDVEPLNHAHAMGAVLAHLYALTGKIEYRHMVERIANFFLASITIEENGSYSWGYRPTPKNMKNHPAEPFWKARVTLMLPLAAYEYGIAFREKDMNAFARTFAENICLGNNRFNRNISRKNLRLLSLNKMKQRYQRRPQLLAGWIFLDRFDSDIRETIENAVAERVDLFPKGWFGHRQAVQAYSYRFRHVKEKTKR